MDTNRIDLEDVMADASYYGKMIKDHTNLETSIQHVRQSYAQLRKSIEDYVTQQVTAQKERDKTICEGVEQSFLSTSESEFLTPVGKSAYLNAAMGAHICSSNLAK